MNRGKGSCPPPCHEGARAYSNFTALLSGPRLQKNVTLSLRLRQLDLNVTSFRRAIQHERIFKEVDRTVRNRPHGKLGRKFAESDLICPFSQRQPERAVLPYCSSEYAAVRFFRFDH